MNMITAAQRNLMDSNRIALFFRIERFTANRHRKAITARAMTPSQKASGDAEK